MGGVVRKLYVYFIDGLSNTTFVTSLPGVEIFKKKVGSVLINNERNIRVCCFVFKLLSLCRRRNTRQNTSLFVWRFDFYLIFTLEIQDSLDFYVEDGGFLSIINFSVVLAMKKIINECF